MTLELWILLGIGAICVILAVVLKNAEAKVYLTLVAIGVFLLGMLAVYYTNAGGPLDYLNAGEEYKKLLEGRDGKHTILVLAKKDSDGTLGNPLFYRIESWKLVDVNEKSLSEVYENFKVWTVTKKITIRKESRESKTGKSKLYCLIPN